MSNQEPQQLQYVTVEERFCKFKTKSNNRGFIFNLSEGTGAFKFEALMAAIANELGVMASIPEDTGGNRVPVDQITIARSKTDFPGWDK